MRRLRRLGKYGDDHGVKYRGAVKKISDYQQNERMNTVQTKEERLVGGHIDYKG